MKRSSQMMASMVLLCAAAPAFALDSSEVPTAPAPLGMPSARSAQPTTHVNPDWSSVLPRGRGGLVQGKALAGREGERVADPGNTEDALRQSPEDFKGLSSTAEMTFGAMGGVALIGNRAGFAVLGNVAKKIVNRGFVPDINDQVYAELEAGPAFFSGPNAFLYSAHLRWDFEKDRALTPYAFGGLSGYAVNGPGDLPIFPRFGAGVFWTPNPVFTVRFELSHELIGAGVSFAL
jgi:hypothetical protein